MRAIHPDTREIGAKLGGHWAVGERVNAVKNKNALRRQKPGVIKAGQPLCLLGMGLSDLTRACALRRAQTRRGPNI